MLRREEEEGEEEEGERGEEKEGSWVHTLAHF